MKVWIELFIAVLNGNEIGHLITTIHPPIFAQSAMMLTMKFNAMFHACRNSSRLLKDL